MREVFDFAGAGVVQGLEETRSNTWSKSMKFPTLHCIRQYHGRFGWGWRHPNQGWHRGWR